MIKKILLVVFLALMTSQMAESQIIDVNSLYIEAEKLTGTNRQYYVPDSSKPQNNFNLGFDLSTFSNRVYFNTLLSSTTDQSQFRYVSMDNEFGFNLAPVMQLYFRHYSGHILDAPDPDNLRFPEENVIGIRFYLINK